MTIELTIDAEKLLRAFERAPLRLAEELDNAIFRAAAEMARTAKQLAPKAYSVLTNSINALREAPLSAIVAVGVDYGRMVEEGTGIHGPEGAPSGVLPPREYIEDWIRVKRITPNDPAMDERDLAWAMAHAIARTGTKPQPFLTPAFESGKARAEQLVDAAIDKALSA